MSSKLTIKNLNIYEKEKIKYTAGQNCQLSFEKLVLVLPYEAS